MGRWIAILLLFLTLSTSPSFGDDSAPAPAATSSDSLPELLRDLPEREARTAGFQGLVPGTTSEAEILEKLGEPKEKQVDEDSTEATWVYEIGPFPQVELTVHEGKLVSVHAQFANPRPIEEIQNELGLAKFAAVPIFKEDDALDSLHYPERGLFVNVADGDVHQGTSIVLAAPDGLGFVLRARHDRSSQLRQQMADLEQALEIDANCEPALAMQLRLWHEMGFPEEALKRAEAMHAQHADFALVELELAQLQIQHRQLDAAREHLKHVLGKLNPQTPYHCRARLLLVDVDRLAMKRTAEESDCRPLVDELSQIIRVAAEITKQGANFEQRVDAREIVLLAHLHAARIISESQWSNREATVATWLTKAESVASKQLEQGYAPPCILLTVWETALECENSLAGKLDPLPVLDRMTRQVDPWLVANKDPLFQRFMRPRYASALLHGARTLQLRGDVQRASIYARRALDIAGQLAQQQPPHREAEILLGEAYFHLGAIYGVAREDHEKALTWYDHAEPLLTAPIPAWCASHRVIVGDQLVSIGISNWELGQKQRGIELSEKGLANLQAAATDGDAPKSSLTTALTNLSYMHSAVGNRDKAREFTELARKLGK